MVDRNVTVALRARVGPYVSDMQKAAKATDRLRHSYDDALASSKRKLGGLGEAATVLGTAVAVKQLTDAASSLSETVNKSGVVFGQNASAVQAWAKTAATSFGQSQQQALEAAATFGNLFVSMRIGQADAATMSTTLVQLASDLASFNNIDPGEALEKLRSGLVGETEPLRALGVTLSAAKVEAKALAMGLAETPKALTPAHKAMATYELILEETATAQGDFGRTADGLANQTRTMNAQFEDAKAALGQALLPALTSAAQATNSLLATFNGLPGPMQQAVLGTGLLGAALVLLLPRAVAAKAALADLGIVAEGSGKRAAAAMKGLGVASAVVAVGLPIIGDGVNSIGDALYGAATPTDMLADSLQSLVDGKFDERIGRFGHELGFLGKELTELADPSWSTKLGDIFGTLGGQGGDVRRQRVLQEIQQLDGALVQMAERGGAPAAKEAFDELTTSHNLSEKQIRTLTELLPQYAEGQRAAARAAGEQAGAQQGANERLRTAEQLTKAYDGALKRLDERLKALTGTQMGADQSTAALEAAYDAAAQAVKENGRTFDVATAKGRANQAALQGVASAALEAIEPLRKNGASAEELGAVTARARGEFVALGRRMGLTAAQAEQLASAYGLVPERVETSVALYGVERAELDLERLARERRVPLRVVVADEGNRARARDQRRAQGGLIRGPGSSTSDSIPARLSDGEYVVRASAVRQVGVGFLDAINSGGAVGFARGGAAGKAAKARAAARQDRIDAARDAHRTAVSDRASESRSVRDSLLGAAALRGSFDFDAHARALQRVADARRDVASAEDEVFAARRRVNSAGSDAERAEAQADLAKATRDLAGAKREQGKAEAAAAAAKPTAANVVNAFAERMRNLAAFRTNIDKLRRMGLHPTLIQEIIAGYGSGGEDYAAALVRATPAQVRQLNGIQNTNGRNATALGMFSAGLSGDRAVASTAQALSAATGRPVPASTWGDVLGRGVTVQVSPTVSVRVDGREIVRAVADVQRRQGRSA